MTDWLQKHMARQNHRFGELATFLKETFPTREGQKGGPGSGHWGHAGRPGQVGGSVAGRMRSSGRVNREYFTKGPGKQIVADLTDEQRNTVINVLAGLKVQPRYLNDLEKVTTKLDVGQATDTWDDCRWAGYYRKSTNTIHVDPDVLAETSVTGGLIPTTSRNVLSHEFGHHITLESRWKKEPGGWWTSQSYDTMYHAWHRRFHEGWRHEFLDMGLRPYSFKNFREFMADTWLVYQYGDAGQQATLAEGLNVNRLGDIFGR